MDSPQSPDVTQDANRLLRLVGVHDDGEHLVLSSPDGKEFVVEITDALRHATTRPIGRSSASAADEAAKVQLTPREIQSKIRAGVPIEELAHEFGLDIKRLRTYEVPIKSEREWISTMAQRVEVSAPQPSYDTYRAVFGDEPAFLGEMVVHRLTALGIDPETAQWDAWREEDSRLWTIAVDFSTDGTETSIGDTPPALWSFKPSSEHLENLNRWAQTLSEMEPMDSPISAPSSRLSAVSPETPFDVESDQPTARRETTHTWGKRTVQADPHEELLDVLNARRGQRLGVDEEGDDELALMITKDENPVWDGPRLVPSEPQEESSAEDQSPSETDSWEEKHVGTRITPITRSYDVIDDTEEDEDDQQINGQTDVFSDMNDEDTGEALKRTQKKEKPKRRSAIPSWDEIMLGTRKDD